MMYTLKKIVISSAKKISGLRTHNKLLVLLQSLSFYIIILFGRNKRNIGAMQSKSNLQSVIYSLLGIIFNVNHLGSAFINKANKLSTTFKMEREVVDWTKKIFHINSSKVEGYITSGGTESNIYIMWCIREMFNKKKNGASCIVVSPLTHYSILKAANILGIKVFYTSLDNKTLSIDHLSLKNLIEKDIKNNFKNIILPVTIGYSSTGTIDNLELITSQLDLIRDKNKDLNISVFVDASAQGLPYAFLNKEFRPFDNKYVASICVDFHKHGRAPIPTGVVLYRDVLRKAIERKIDYLAEFDVTLSGSRPGFSAMAIWSNITSVADKEWKRDFENSHNNKTNFINNFDKYFSKGNIINSEKSLTCSIVVDKNFKRLPQWVEHKYSLYLASVKTQNPTRLLNHYKIHFMNHIPREVYKNFIDDILKSNYKNK